MGDIIKFIKGHFISAAFIVIITVGAVSVGADFYSIAIYRFLHSDASVSLLLTDSWKKVMDIRDGDEILEPHKYLKSLYIYAYGLTQHIVGNDYVYDADPTNDVVRMKNGYLTTTLPKLSNKQLSKITGGIKVFSDALSKEDINFLYVQLPFKVCPYDKELPVGVKDYSNEDADKVLSALEADAVNTLDMRTQIEKSGLDWYSLFFRTDHHWKPTTALWASQRLCEVLNGNYGFKIDTCLLDISRFSQTTYKKRFLGSLGKRVGRFYAGVDDFTLVLPKYDTDMVFSSRDLSDNYLSGDETARSGSFEDAFIFKPYLDKDLMNINTYASYSGNDYPETVTKNNRISDGRILLIRDSFCDTAAPFLSLAACRELYTLDLRYYYGSVEEYVKKVQPDIVIVMLNPSLLPSFSLYRYDFMSGV